MKKFKKIEGYIAFNQKLLNSAAMKGLSINCWRLIHFLMIEHLKKGWAGDGAVKAPYSQLQEFGIPRRYINKTIAEAEARELILVERGARAGRRNYDNVYHLTFASNKEGVKRNNWRKFKDSDLEKLLSNKKKKRMLKSGNNLVPQTPQS